MYRKQLAMAALQRLPLGKMVPVAKRKGNGSRMDCLKAFEMPLEAHDVPIGHDAILVVLPHSEDDVLDDHIRRGDDDGDPYWATLWPSSIALAEEFYRRPSLVKGRHIVDIGAGVGLAGMSAAMNGARSVTLLDKEVRALVCAGMGAERNGLEWVALDTTVAETFRKCPASKREGGGYEEWKATIGLRQFDWHEQGGEGGENGETWKRDLDAVLACDVLYEARNIDAVAQTVLNLRRGGEFELILSDPQDRNPDNRQRFLDALGERAAMLEDRQIAAEAVHDKSMNANVHVLRILIQPQR